MAQNTAIEWANIPGYTPRTWNPLAGCTRRSEECDLCYAAGMAIRLEAMANADFAAGRDPGGKEKYIGTARRNHAGRAAFVGVVNLDWEALDEPATWRKPSAVFVNSMSDLFHAAVPDRFILETFHAMRKTPQHIYMVLTKRPERMAEWTGKHYPLGLPPNIWCGTSIGLDAYTPRADYLRRVPAAVRFLSCEPLLSGLPSLSLEGIHQVIVGGESGTGARPMNPDWARDLRDRCQSANAPFFFKQWGAWVPGYSRDGEPFALVNGSYFDTGETWPHPRVHVWETWQTHNGDYAGYHCRASVLVGKHAAGRLLDGQEWNQFPVVQEVTR